MKRILASILVLACVLVLAGCASSKSFSFANVQKIVLTSIDGRQLEISDAETIRQITDNISALTFQKGRSSRNTNGFGPFVQWYDAEGKRLDAISVLDGQTIMYDDHFWTTDTGSIDKDLIDRLLKDAV